MGEEISERYEKGRGGREGGRKGKTEGGNMEEEDKGEMEEREEED